MCKGIIFIYFGLNLVVFGVVMINSACYGAFVCDLQFIDTGTLILISALLIVGLVFIYIGIKKIWENVVTNRKGVEKYGIVVECFEKRERKRKSGHYILKVLIIDDEDNVRKFDKFCVWGYGVGAFLIVKYYKNHINIIDCVSSYLVPDFEKYKLKSSYNDYINNNKDNKKE